MARLPAMAGMVEASSGCKRVKPSNSESATRPSSWPVMRAGSSDSGSPPFKMTMSARFSDLAQPLVKRRFVSPSKNMQNNEIGKVTSEGNERKHFVWSRSRPRPSSSIRFIGDGFEDEDDGRG